MPVRKRDSRAKDLRDIAADFIAREYKNSLATKVPGKGAVVQRGNSK